MSDVQFQNTNNFERPSSSGGTSRQNYSRQSTTSDDVVRAASDFGVSVFQKVSDPLPCTSVIVSPKSVNNALHLVGFGALEDTKQQIENAFGGIALGLHFSQYKSSKKSSIKHFAGKLLKKVSSIDGSSSNSSSNSESKSPPNELAMETAFFTEINRLCIKKGVHVNSSFVSGVKSVFGAKTDQLDFSGHPDRCVESINSWVEKHTENKIHSIVSPDDVTRETSLIVLNAIYFKGDWEDKFDAINTKRRPFKTSADAAAVMTEFMFKNATTLYCRDDALKCSVVELPYAGRELSFVVILPDAVDGLRELQRDVSVASLERMFGNVTAKSDVLLYLPKFKVETTVELSEHLKALGIVDLFSQQKANLGGIEPKGALYVSAMAHKACIEVTEEGCEAAAVTAGLVRAAGGRTKAYTVFDADHPFLFLIKQNATNMILFIGKYCGPSLRE